VPPPPAPPVSVPVIATLPVLDTEEQQALPSAATVSHDRFVTREVTPEQEQRRAAREAVARAAEAAAEETAAPSPLGGLRADLEGILPATPQPRRPRSRTAPVVHEPEPVEEPTPLVREGSLRNQVYQVLHEHVPANDRSDVVALTNLVGDLLDLDDVDRLTASNYVRTWKSEADAGRRAAVNGRHLQGIVPAKG
jgi:hypothetical protein